MFDSFNRSISYLRISVTDRCNLRCLYCMPEEGVRLLSHKEILSFEEIIQVVRAGIDLGIEKVRITGGEPLVRKGIEELVHLLSLLPGITDLSMTTNGVLLESKADSLFAAGLKRINISLDTLDPSLFASLTRGGKLEQVLAGIMKAKVAGFYPIKINCVVQASRNEPQAKAVEAFCMDHGFFVRFIPSMDLETGHFGIVDGGTGGDCSVCNRLRLTANGKIKPCLFNEMEFDVRELGPEKAIRLAIQAKPPCGSFNSSGSFYNIGG